MPLESQSTAIPSKISLFARNSVADPRGQGVYWFSLAQKVNALHKPEGGGGGVSNDLCIIRVCTDFWLPQRSRRWLCVFLL